MFDANNEDARTFLGETLMKVKRTKVKWVVNLFKNLTFPSSPHGRVMKNVESPELENSQTSYNQSESSRKLLKSSKSFENFQK